jgi:superfamily I DNA and RNA helicase
MLDVIYGHISKQEAVQKLVRKLKSLLSEGILFIGYPIIATADESVEVDALMICKKNGLVAFKLMDGSPKKSDQRAWQDIKTEQDRLYFALKNNLGRHDNLRAGRELGVTIETVVIFPDDPTVPKNIEDGGGYYTNIDGLSDVLQRFTQIDIKFYRPLQAALQRVSIIKPAKKRPKAITEGSRGSILKEIEREIANLDKWQMWAAIESYDGPQRIRGLAGSGKTIVLALKAAYLHSQNPDWIIAVTFYTRSLYQQFEDLIRRFCFEHMLDEPNWNNLKILHAWGGTDKGGVYSDIAKSCDMVPSDFMYAKNKFGMPDAFDGVCSELLRVTEQKSIKQLYDAVLIDEAQDLPPSFFKLVYRFTKEPKKIIWAYDELQKLSETGMPSTDELFGRNEDGDAVVTLLNRENEPRQDVVLPVCYRNTPWALTLAHALGFGIYRKDGILQHFDDPNIWNEIGYRTISGKTELGKRVSLARRKGSSPDYFDKLISRDNAIVTRVFNDNNDQASWIAENIFKHLSEDELDFDDILIILPRARTARREAILINNALNKYNLNSHLAGVTSSRDELFRSNSIAIANIFRSKGNEAPVIYIPNCDQCYSGPELITIRNTIFTAITRSRAWVYLSGIGQEMTALSTEITKVINNEYVLDFVIPTEPELIKMRQIHKEKTIDEKKRFQEVQSGLKGFLDAIENGDISIDQLPLHLRTKLARIIKKESKEDDFFD